MMQPLQHIQWMVMHYAHLAEGLLPLGGFGGAELSMLITIKANSSSSSYFTWDTTLNSIFSWVQASKKMAEVGHVL